MIINPLTDSPALSSGRWHVTYLLQTKADSWSEISKDTTHCDSNDRDLPQDLTREALAALVSS